MNSVTCSAPTMLIGLHLNRWLMNLGMKELEKRDKGDQVSFMSLASTASLLTWETCFNQFVLK